MVSELYFENPFFHHSQQHGYVSFPICGIFIFWFFWTATGLLINIGFDKSAP